MRSFNVALAILVSILLATGVLEVGLRVLGMGPQPTINRFDPSLGWSKTPGATSVRKTRECTVHTAIETTASQTADARVGSRRTVRSSASSKQPDASSQGP